MSVPYERLIQWAAGPIAILAGWLATQLVNNVGLFGSLGLGQNQIAHAIVAAATFIVGAGVTYAAHHKWLSNLQTWWARNEAIPLVLPVLGELPPPDSSVTPDPGLPVPAAPPVA